MNILNYFPAQHPPREGQRVALETVEANWDKADVFVIEAPTAFGKTNCMFTTSKWAHKERGQKSIMLTPTNVLREQLKRDLPRLFILKKRHEYECLQSTSCNSVNCQQYYNEHAAPCKGCPYTKALRQARVMPYQANNLYAYMAHKLYQPVLILDEAHNLVPFLKDLASRKLWHSEYKFPSTVRDYRSLLRWVEKELESIPRVEGNEELPPRFKRKKKNLEILHEDLIGGAHRYLVERGTDTFRGVKQECLKLLPIDTSQQPPILWPPGRVKKIVLFSATIGPSDLHQMGLSDRRVCWISGQSPIPPERRPVIQERFFDMSYKAQGKDLDSLVEYVQELLSRHQGERGLIHCTYSLSQKLKAKLSHSTHASRLLFHTRDNKDDKYKEFLKSAPGTVLVCCGLYEGIDLPGDLGRWQLVTKCPWASLSDPAMKHLADAEWERYAWECAKLVLQACGRVCRGPEDFGVSYISDKSFERIPEELLPSWFKSALLAGKEMLNGGWKPKEA